MSPRILFTSFGFNDPGGGTTVPRVVSKELARRGWEVTVFHAATAPDPGGGPYSVRTSHEDGVDLVAVHNRPHGLWDLGNPLREIDDPAITRAFADTLDRVRPDVVHFHNLHNLGAALIDQAAARGVPAYFSTHNYWLVCPRAYLITGQGQICAGPGDNGGDCASCVGSPDRPGHRERLGAIRERFTRGVDVCLAVSDAMRATLVAQGYPAEMIDVVRQSVPATDDVWAKLGATRAPGRSGERLTVAFFGSAYGHKGPQLLAEAAQRTEHELRVLIHGEVQPNMERALRRIDGRGVVEVRGAFDSSELPGLLAGVDAAVMPSMWWDCAPLAAAECLAGRVPLVAPRLGGLGEAVRDEVDGLLFEGLDAADLARQLDRLAGEPGLLERLQAGIEAPRPFAEYVDELEAYYRDERTSRGVARAAPTAVAWHGDHGLHTSLSTINDAVAGRIARHGVRVQRVRRDGAVLDAPLPHPADVEIRHQWPPDLRPPRSGRLAIIQPWEFGAIPADWVAPLQRDVDEVWVPSEFVRAMYLQAGIEADRVHVVPNGVDLDRFAPEGPRLDLDRFAAAAAPAGLRFLFVGGAIQRKGVDVLLAAWQAAFAGREDVTLVVKDFGSGGVYRNADRTALQELAASGAAPRVVHLDADLSGDDLAALYRACDVFVHPYRGEGFAMPVLEAMASGLPVIATAGGPTDEFCPPQAGWRIDAARKAMPGGRVDSMETAGEPWMLEPSVDHLVALLREAAQTTAEERAARGAAGRSAAERYTWDVVTAAYAGRVRALAQRPLRTAGEPIEALQEATGTRVLATPAWRADDDLGALLAAWGDAAPAGTDATLFLLADPDVDGDGAALQTRVIAAADAAGADLDNCADIAVLQLRAYPGRDAALHADADAYVPLHRACAGHERLARAAGAAIVAPDALRAWLAAGDRVAA